MRLLIDAIIAVCLIGLLATVMTVRRTEAARSETVEATRQAIDAIESEAIYQAALGEVELSDGGWPLEIQVSWFDRIPPHPMFADRVPYEIAWLEHADQAEQDLEHPRQKHADVRHGAFWYNPDRGIVRARVPRQPTDQATEQLYRRINR
jgi:hypothetical protein